MSGSIYGAAAKLVPSVRIGSVTLLIKSRRKGYQYDKIDTISYLPIDDIVRL